MHNDLLVLYKIDFSSPRSAISFTENVVLNSLKNKNKKTNAL